MIVDQLSKEYENGVLEFVKFVVEHVKDSSQMKCPCLGCCYVGRVDADGFKSHLLMRGIDRSYMCWIFHGEKVTTMLNRGRKVVRPMLQMTRTQIHTILIESKRLQMHLKKIFRIVPKCLGDW